MIPIVTLHPLLHRNQLCVAIRWQNSAVVERVVRSFPGRLFSITLDNLARTLILEESNKDI